MYETLARYYDRLMSDVDYDGWSKRLIDFLRQEAPKASTGLDLACGTGGFTTRLAKAGYRMIGSDPSEEMLTEARRNSAKLPILYVCQSASETALASPVDFMTMMCDGVNYCTDGVDFGRLSSFLKPDGWLIFDISGYRYLTETLAGQVYYEDRDELTYFWTNEYDERTHILDLRLTFFERRKDGHYDRFDETQTMRAYTIRELEQSLEPYFEVRTAGELFETEVDDDNRRVHFFCKKR